MRSVALLSAPRISVSALSTYQGSRLLQH